MVHHIIVSHYTSRWYLLIMKQSTIHCDQVSVVSGQSVQSDWLHVSLCIASNLWYETRPVMEVKCSATDYKKYFSHLKKKKRKLPGSREWRDSSHRDLPYTKYHLKHLQEALFLLIQVYCTVLSVTACFLSIHIHIEEFPYQSSLNKSVI